MTISKFFDANKFYQSIVATRRTIAALKTGASIQNPQQSIVIKADTPHRRNSVPDLSVGIIKQPARL
jgi:hypothetical protein